jgi:hypothetical protein
MPTKHHQLRYKEQKTDRKSGNSGRNKGKKNETKTEKNIIRKQNGK